MIFFPRKRLDFGEEGKGKKIKGKGKGREGLIFFPRGSKTRQRHARNFFSLKDSTETLTPLVTGAKLGQTTIVAAATYHGIQVIGKQTN